MIEFSAHPARPAAAALGRNQSSSSMAEKQGFAAVLADAAEPERPSEPEAEAPDEPSGEPSPAPPAKAGARPSTSAKLPLTGKILPDAPVAIDEAVTLDAAPAKPPKEFARIALLNRNLTPVNNAADEPASANNSAEHEHAADAPGDAPPATIITQLFDMVVAQPISALLSLSEAAAKPSANTPVQTSTSQAAAAAAQASGADASTAVATANQAARIAATDPRVFGITLQRETQVFGDGARPQSSAAGISELAPLAGIETKREDGAQSVQTLALNNALIADGSALANSPATAAVRNAAPAGERIDFAALVDSVARARENAAGPQDVAVALTHAEFGKVSLRFQNEDNGLSVSMMSPDPGFAPAVAAARMADAADQRPQGQNSQNSSSQNPGSQNSSQAQASQSGVAGDGAAGTRGGSSQRQEAQNQGRAQTDPRAEQERNAATGDDLRRSAIWA